MAEVTGIGLVEVFAGLTLALAVLAGLTALAMLRGLRPSLRVPSAALVALCYLAAAYLAQGAFKEPLMALLLLGLVAWLEAWPGGVRAVVPVAVIAGGVVFAYSLPGLLWVAAVLAAVALARYLHLRASSVAAGGLAQTFGPLGRGARRRGRRDRGDRVGPDLEVHPPRRAQPGPLRLPARQPRAVAEPARGARDLAGQRVRRHLDARRACPPLAFYLGAAVALAAFAAGLWVALRERRLALPAAALAALAVWVFLALVGEPLRRREGTGDRGAARDRGRRCAGRWGRGRGPCSRSASRCSPAARCPAS